MESFFIIADDIQRLPNDKVFAMGIYSDRVLVLNIAPNQQQGSHIAITKLHMLVTMRGLPVGEHDVGAAIVYPDGTSAPKLTPAGMSVLAKGSAALFFGFAPFPVPQEGRYTLKLEIAGETIENHFTIWYRVASEASSPTRKVTVKKKKLPVPENEGGHELTSTLARKKATSTSRRSAEPEVAPVAKRVRKARPT